MVDNVSVTPGAGAVIAADEIGGVLYQRVKATFGEEGSATDVSATNPLPVDTGDISIVRDSAVMWEDNFNNGFQGWVPLVSGSTPCTPLCLDTTITYAGSAYSLLLATENITDGTTNLGACTAIKRMGRGPHIGSTGKIYAEFFWAWGSVWGNTVPRAIDFGIDQADPDGNRKYFKLRWFNYDNTVPGRVTKYQLLNSSGTYTDIPGAVIDHGYNENKRNLHHTEFIFDIEAGVYDGVRVNGQGFGSLASTPDTSLRAYGPAAETLTGFKSGFNVSVDLRNRIDTNATRAWANLAYSRGVML